MLNTKKLSYTCVVALGFMVYLFSYTMRLDYSATIVAIVEDLKISNTAASAAVTGSFITYGVGQIICGFVGDKISPVKMISYAMLGTILVNVSVSFCHSITVITVLWCLNGFFQAMIWPPLTRFVAEQLDKGKYSDAITVISMSASVGTVLIYLLVPLILRFSVWRNVFRCMGLFGVMVIIIWYLSTKGRYQPKKIKSDNKVAKGNYSFLKLISIAGLVPIFIIIILNGILRDGIQTWLPSFVNTQFNVSASASILSTAILPLLSITSMWIANILYRRLKNEIKTTALIFAIAFLATLPLALGLKIPFYLSVLLASIISACMHGANLMITAFIPKHFVKYGMVSTFSGVINSFTYIGAAASSYGFAAVSDNCGWSAVLMGWSVVALLGTVISFLKIKKWTKFI